MPKKQPNKRKAGRTRKRRPASDASTKRLAWIMALAVTAAIAYLVSSAKKPGHNPGHNAGDLTAVITNPNLPETLLRYEGMTISFNPDTPQPNWASWELLASEATGDAPRSDSFAPDPEVEGCATLSDYRRSGYDRGHMAPAGDMKWSAEAMRQSFLLTNVCPQKGDLNRGAWQKLEEKCRQKALTDSAVIIVCGPVFLPGEGIERIGATGVAVPRRFFKVILSPYIDHPTAIGFIMPNGPVAGGMMPHAVSVDSVEALTGHDFFAELPDEIETIVESQCDFNRWSRIRRRK